ncbi:MAG: hypothetical protein WBP45_11065 [Daejeonella sp.]
MDDKDSSGDNFLNEIITVLDDCFKPVDSLKELDQFITTEDVFDAVQAIYPSTGLFGYTSGTIAVLMLNAGYKFTALPSGNVQFVWLMKRR